MFHDKNFEHWMNFKCLFMPHWNCWTKTKGSHSAVALLILENAGGGWAGVQKWFKELCYTVKTIKIKTPLIYVDLTFVFYK
jgi:hypothetical protein